MKVLIRRIAPIFFLTSCLLFGGCGDSRSETQVEQSAEVNNSKPTDTPEKKPMYRYPGQREEGKLIWSGYINNHGCYLDTNSVHVFDNTSEYKDWEQVVMLYDDDKFLESVKQNFHWDPQNGACVGGRGISKITDNQLMYQFEAGWQCAFGYSYSSMKNNSSTSSSEIPINSRVVNLLRERIFQGGNSKKWTRSGMSPARPYEFSAANLCYRTNLDDVYFIAVYYPDKMQKACFVAQIDLNAERMRFLECYVRRNIAYGDQEQVRVNSNWETDLSLSTTSGKNITFVHEYCNYLREHLNEIPNISD